MNKIKNKLPLLATFILVNGTRYDDVFAHPRHFSNNIRKYVPCKSITVKPIIKQEHEFNIKGHTIMANSRKDAIKRLKKKGIL